VLGVCLIDRGWNTRAAVTATAGVLTTTPGRSNSCATTSRRRSGRPSSAIRVSMSNLFSAQYASVMAFIGGGPYA
jgi:hypothetical protein